MTKFLVACRRIVTRYVGSGDRAAILESALNDAQAQLIEAQVRIEKLERERREALDERNRAHIKIRDQDWKIDEVGVCRAAGENDA